MPPFNEYHHQALRSEDAVRLILLDAAADEEAPLSCSLIQHCPSERHLDYYAISYAWGTQQFTRNLEIRYDGDDTSYLRITSNVDTVLRRFRAPVKPRYLWIDAVCLNQDDELEKAQQIPIMGLIYELARDVCIWLGPGNQDTVNLFALFQHVSGTGECEQRLMAGRVAFLMGKSLGLNGLGCVLDFFRQRWFSRRWVIQEACLARQATVHCGSNSIPLPNLVLFAQRFQALDMSDYNIKMTAKLCRPTRSLSILELLWNFHEADCLDNKDRVAALFGLVPAESRFQLDYTAHWTELYKQVALFTLQSGSQGAKVQLLLHLFEFGPVTAVRDGSYPSWVPDWSQPRQRSLPFHSQIRNVDTFEPYPACPGYHALSSLTFHHGSLSINWYPSMGGPHGLQVTFAKSFSLPPRSEKQSEKRVVALLRGLFPNIPDSAPHILALSSLVKAIIGFRHSSLDQPSNTPSFVEYLSGIRRVLPKSSGSESIDSFKSLGSLLQEFCLFRLEAPRSESGTWQYYGIGPRQVQVDDVMIPIWRSGWNSDADFVLPGEKETAMHATTMLAVRHTLEEETTSPKGKVIGPALCVMSDDMQGKESNGREDAGRAGRLGSDQLYSMCLV